MTAATTNVVTKKDGLRNAAKKKLPWKPNAGRKPRDGLSSGAWTPIHGARAPGATAGNAATDLAAG